MNEHTTATNFIYHRIVALFSWSFVVGPDFDSSAETLK